MLLFSLCTASMVYLPVAVRCAVVAVNPFNGTQPRTDRGHSGMLKACTFCKFAFDTFLTVHLYVAVGWDSCYNLSDAACASYIWTYGNRARCEGASFRVGARNQRLPTARSLEGMAQLGYGLACNNGFGQILLGVI